MVSITGGINWVKQQARDPHRYAVRAKEVIGAACSGAVFGAVSKAVRDYVGSPQAQRDALSHAAYSTAAIGGAAALIIGGMAGYRIVEKYAGAETAGKWKAAGAAGGALLFGAGSALAAMPFLKLSAASAEQLAQRLAPYLSNVAGAVSSKVVQSFIANLHSREATQWQPAGNRQQITADVMQIVRCLCDSLPRMSLLSIPALTASYAAAIGSHAGLGAAGSLLGNAYDWARGTDRYQNLTHDRGYAHDNRHVVPEPCAQLGMKVALGLAVAWAASSIAPGIIDATNASTEMKLVTFALAGCAVNALFADPARQLIRVPAGNGAPPQNLAVEPPPQQNAGQVAPQGNPRQNDQQPPQDALADDRIGGHDGDPRVGPENEIEMEELANIQ